MAPIKIAVYDTKPYDVTSLESALKNMKLEKEFTLTFMQERLSLESTKMATGHEAVCAFVNDDVSKAVVTALNSVGVKLLLMRCAGFDRVDMAACHAIGICVARVPAYSPYAVAEFAVALLSALNRKTHRAYNRVRDGNFTLSGFVGMDIHGKTVGVIGTGKIGRCFIDIMLGFGCKILAYDVFESEELKQLPNVQYVSLEDALRNSDIVSLHAPLTKESEHLINTNSLSLMKSKCLLINTSRGKLVDTAALVNALMKGKLGGAALDVYENEEK